MQTDIVRFELRAERLSVPEFLAAMRERGVLLGAVGGRSLRAVTHYGLEASQIRAAIDAARSVIGGA